MATSGNKKKACARAHCSRFTVAHAFESCEPCDCFTCVHERVPTQSEEKKCITCGPQLAPGDDVQCMIRSARALSRVAQPSCPRLLVQRCLSALRPPLTDRLPPLRCVHTAAAKKKHPYPITEELDLPYLNQPAMAPKRKNDSGEAGSSKAAKGSGKQLVNPKRWRELKEGDVGKGPILYWCATTCLAARLLVIRARYSARPMHRNK